MSADEAIDRACHLWMAADDNQEPCIAAFRRALAEAGWAVVPVEPTPAMISAGWKHTADPCWPEDVAKCYRAMIAAAREG